MTSPVAKIHPMITSQIRSARVRAGQIEAVAEHLAELMRAVHGGEWTYGISHKDGAEFIIVKPAEVGKC